MQNGRGSKGTEILNRLSADTHTMRWPSRKNEHEIVNFALVIYLIGFAVGILWFLLSIPPDNRESLPFTVTVSGTSGALFGLVFLLTQMFLSRADKKEIMGKLGSMDEKLDSMDKKLGKLDSIEAILLRIEAHLKAGTSNGSSPQQYQRMSSPKASRAAV